uniref:Uncharacterized protein n=1 Tax=Rhizophora mucronata TaxID=61149 RepID=A0A2P2NDN0_RHIMU
MCTSKRADRDFFFYSILKRVNK